MPELLLAPLAVLLALLVLATASATGARVLAGGPGGASPWPDVARLLVERRRTTTAPDALLWRVGGGGLLVAAAAMLAVVPVEGRAAATTSVGVVWLNAMDVLLWVLAWSLGWGAAGVLGLVGGYRYLGQALAYELPLMFALTAPALAAGSLDLREVVAAQQGGSWFVLQMPVALLVVLVGIVAFSFWGPFRAPVGADLGGGALAELSGVDRLVVLAGRHALLGAGAAFVVPLFLGGGDGPLLPGWAWQAVKTLAVLALLLALRTRLPVVRPERFAEIGWLVLLPLTLLQLLVTSLVVLA